MAVIDPRIAPLLAAAAQARARSDRRGEVTALDAALTALPDCPHANNARGMRALVDGDFALARDHFGRAVASDPGEPVLHINFATAARGLNDDIEERAALDAVLALDRTNYQANLRLAELHERLGQTDDAARSWSAVVQLALMLDERPPAVDAALQRGQAFLTAHNAATAARVDAAVGETLAQLGRAGKRVAACLDHGLGRRAIYANQCSGVYFPFLPADEFFDNEAFPWFADLEASTAAMRDEATSLLARGGDAIRPYVRMEAGTPDSKWSPLDNSLDWSACFLWEYGVRNDAVCEACPQTAAALARLPQNHIPGKAPSAFFSILRPGAHIPPHTGVTNTRAIVHLPLFVPDGCRFRVGGETRAWIEGKAFAFDDTIEHEAWNASNHPRIVLIFDVWNPHLTPEEQAVLVEYYRAVEAV